MDLREISIHDQRITYRTAGSGPVLLLIHGMAGSATTWREVMPGLAERFKPLGDYSVGAFACRLRDLLVALGHERATVVGQSLGGGVALQFSYQYPERTERLVLVGSGGLGQEVNPILRFLSLPGAEAVLQLACAAPVRGAIGSVGSGAARVGLRPAPVVAELWRSYASLGDADARSAFMRTLRAVVDPRGQAVSASNRLHLAAEVPTLIIWGDADPIIPVDHAYAAHASMPVSRLEIFENVGHYPHCEAPERFVAVLSEFIEGTVPARLTIGAQHVLREAGG